ncbi:MAG TPA: ABC transporter substrate binding protein [Dongiaceae bacterium]|nr:ABC transporter substrate binding protein [Dongiaceae bacterium]
MSAVCGIAVATVERPPGRTVLFIASYHPGFPTFFDQIAGLRQVLDDAHVNLDIEFMDAKRFYTPEDQDIFRDSLSKKLQKLPRYDLVIVADDAALQFIDRNHKALFPEVPVVFFGVNDVPYARSFNRNPLITGVVEEVSFRETLVVIRQLFGTARPITVVADGSESGQASLQLFIAEAKALNESNYSILSLTDVSYAELAEMLSHLPATSIVIPLSIFRDRTGATREFAAAFGLIRSSTSAPIFHFWYHGIGKGVLGGKLVSHRKQAVMAAEIAVRILTGTSPSLIKVQEDSGNEFVFDYQELQRFDLDESDLPDGSQILNQPDPVSQRYRRITLATAAFAVVLVTVVGILLIRMRMREHVAQRMLRINQELEDKVSARTLALAQANQEAEHLLRMRNSILDNSLVAIVLMKGRMVDWINHHAEELFGYSLKEAVGRTSDFIYERLEDFERLGVDAPPVLRRGDSYRAEFPYKRKDGTLFWGIISGKAINPDNLAEGALFIIMDITARKQAEERLKKVNLQLENQATTDHLTGIANRRHVTAQLNAEIGRSNRYAEPFSVILLDVDHFKLINDQHGHDAGDRVLKGIATLLRQTCRVVDSVARWGGEEFLILCPSTELADAVRLAELLRSRIEQQDFNLNAPVTSSFGVAAHQSGQTLDNLIKAADSALYEAKITRNCVRQISDSHLHSN